MDFISKTREFNSETQVNTETWEYTNGDKGIKISYWNENRSIFTRTNREGIKQITEIDGKGTEKYYCEYPPQPEFPRVYKTYAPSTYIETPEPEPKKEIGRPPLNKPKIEIEKKAIGRPPLNKPKIEIEKKALGRPPLNKPKIEKEKKALGRPKVGRSPEAIIRDKLLKQIKYNQKYYNLVLCKEEYISKTNEELELYITQLKK